MTRSIPIISHHRLKADVAVKACLHLSGLLAAVALVICAAHPAFAGESRAKKMRSARLREERVVQVNGHPEVWRLEWRAKPVPECGPTDFGWETCPCEGFAFGERGPLDLVRLRGGKEIERLSLTPLFDGDDDLFGRGRGAILRRVKPTAADEEEDSREQQRAGAGLPDTARLASAVRARPPESVMNLGDYDHDGQATEFLLQIGAGFCDWREAVVVGVSHSEPHLHAFHAIGQREPLALHPDHWKALLAAKGPIRRVDTSWGGQCGNHGSETETELELSADSRGISVSWYEYECDANGHRGRLIHPKPARAHNY